MAEPDFQAAIDKYRSQKEQHMKRFEEFREKYRQATKKAWALQLDCYMAGNAECVHEFNQIYLQHHRVSREKLAHQIKCFTRCNEDYGGIQLNEKNLSMKMVNDVKDYVGCIRPCIETQISYTKREIDVMDKAIAQVNKFLKK